VNKQQQIDELRRKVEELEARIAALEASGLGTFYAPLPNMATFAPTWNIDTMAASTTTAEQVAAFGGTITDTDLAGGGWGDG
jgi:hypothetical protein